MSLSITKGQIGNALTSTASDHVVAVAADIYDESAEKYQSQVNSETSTALGNLQSGVTLATMILMTEEEYEAALEAGTIDPTRFYAIYEDEE